MEKPVVLVVDDEETNREICSEALELDGYEAVTASGTQEAVQVLSTREVAAVVCDIQMPHNGIRVYEYLLQKFPELSGRFIFVTGSPARKAEVDNLPSRVPCLLKPFSIRTLLETMRAALLGNSSLAADPE